MGRVRIGTCSDPADAAVVRSVFDAHEIPIVINAEQHASVLGGLGGAFVPLHIYVNDEYAEEAAALLADMRRDDESDPERAGDEARAGDDAGDEAGDAAGDTASDEPRDEPAVELQVERRRRTAIALLLGCCVTFGTAHMSTGAWLRGMAIAGLEALAIKYMVAGNMDLGTLILVACVATDVIGGIWRARTLTPQPRKVRLPVARARR
jgi:hypothetical protein